MHAATRTRLPASLLFPFVLLVVTCAPAPTAARASPATVEPKSMLILLAGQPGLPAGSAIAGGVRAALLAMPSLQVSIETEYVDTARFSSPAEEERRLRDQLQSKYRGRPFDVIVVASNESLGFFLRAREQLWPGIPAIVCAVDERSVSGLALPEAVTLVTVRYDVEGTLRVALTLLPDTRAVALTGGIAPQDRRFQDFARQALRTSRLDLIDLTGLPMADVMARVAELPPHTIVLVSSILMDGSGQRFYGRDVVGPMSRAAKRPMFSFLGPIVGLGIVGGSVVDFDAIGREAGALALRSLRGEVLPRSPIASTASRMPRFDGRELRRWRLDERRLPVGSQILFPQPGFWRQQRWTFVAVTGLLIVLLAFVGGLLLRRRELRIQARLAERLRFETLMADVSRTFADLPAGRVDEHIRECLRRVVLFLQVDRAALWLAAPGGELLTATHVWAVEGTPPPASIELVSYPVLRRLTKDGLPFRFGRRDELADPNDRQAFEKLGIKSFAAIPLRISERRLGFLTFVNLNAERSWSDDVLEQVRTLGELFASALSRKETTAALENSEAFTSAILAALPGETAIVDADGVIVQVNEAWAAFVRTVGLEAQGPITVGGNYLHALERPLWMPDDFAHKGGALLESVLRGKQEEAALEYPSFRGGEERWFEMRVRRLARPGGGAAVMHFDVTTRRRAEAVAQRHLGHIAHLDRVAGMGQLASSIAHELNQPLTAILSNAQAAQRLLATEHPDVVELYAALTDIVQDDQRAVEVIRRMRTLLRKDELTRLPLDLNELARATIALVANDALLHYVTIELEAAAPLPVVHGDPVQVQQVILNLLANAITAAAVGPGDRRVAVWTAAGERYVELGVRDSGPGIPERDLDRLFEPFFTTKAEGLGMGLAISLSIVEAHGGRLVAENDPAGGAVFRMQLPRP